ncbi:MAG: EamA family transporter, partial [Armatimonadetes bacterium]|nr:EamA family transporter [Armatimonadota bacterium]
GVLFLVGNVAFYKLVHSHQVAVVVPFTAVYVAIPVLLGAVCLREQLSRAQWCGVVLAVVACCLLSVRAPDTTGDAPAAATAPVDP